VWRRRRLPPDLVAYVGLALLGLHALAEQRAPHFGLTEAGCRVGFVYDGDTVELLCGNRTQRARLVGFDTPETKEPGCPAEAALGMAAKLRLGDLVARGPGGILLDDRGQDRYGRRLVAMRIDGRDVGAVMIAEGLAVAYDGGRRIDWCARLGG
jgi:endonuclease YncB( thermonuclease family)